MGIEGYYEDYFDERQEKEKLTNFQKIKNMSLDEMAEFLNNRNYCELKTPCRECKNKVFCEAETADDFKKWLEEEAL